MPRRVLVVAGRDGVAPALQTQVELWGDVLDFSVATSGNEALWEIRGSPYDLVLAPWQVPEMTGMEFAEVVQALSPATKVILIGVPVTPAIRSQAESLGVYALLSTVPPEEVAAVVSRAVEMPIPLPRPVPLPFPERPAVSEAARPSPPEPVPSPLPAEPGEREALPTSQPEPTTAAVPEEAIELEVPPQVQAEPTAPPVRAEKGLAAVEPKPAAAAAPTRLEPTRAPAVALTPAQKEAVRRALRDLLVSVGPQVAFLASAAGDLLVIEGTTGDLDVAALAERAVTVLSGADELARILADEDLSGLSLFTGSRYDVYGFTVTNATALVFVFDKRVVEGKLGSVWLYTRRVVEELREAIS